LSQYFEGTVNPLEVDQAAIAAGVAQAYAATAMTQQEAHDFFVDRGASVIGGHSNVGQPGRMGDPDPALDASDE
jgi:hypothetical protein